ncbi:MAG: hypothetical protein IIB03_10950, partial [Acidobacteria bacterium]|nr:hypothetical protein [Acidobacteriota bacterium]
MEDHFSKELLESQGRRDGVFIRFNENRYWDNVGKFGNLTPGNLSTRGPFVEFIDAFRDGYIEDRPDLVLQRSAAIGLLRGYMEGTLTASEVFDVELMGRFLAVSELWDTWHAVGWRQLRFYFNPITARLEPVGFDAQPPSSSSSNTLVAFNEGLIEDLVLDPMISEPYVRELDRMSSPDYLAELKEKISSEYDDLSEILFGELGYLPTPWESIERRQRAIRNSISPSINVFGSIVDGPTDLESESGKAVSVEVRNLLALPVEVLGFRIDGGELIPANEALYAPNGEGNFVSRGSSVILLGSSNTREDFPGALVSFRIPEESLSSDRQPAAVPGEGIEVITSILGLTQNISAAIGLYPSLRDTALIPAAPSIEEALAAHPFLEIRRSTGDLTVQPGEWSVSGDLVLPQDSKLVIGPDTTLLFETGAIMHASGPLEFLGTAEGPVVLGPQGASWGGIVVLKAGEPSSWDYVDVSGTSGISRQGWMLTGGITFFESPVVLQNCRITGSFGEDALNIIRTDFQIDACEFGDAASDAFDGDFVTGSITRSSFHDIANDAIDFSGSSVE